MSEKKTTTTKKVAKRKTAKKVAAPQIKGPAIAIVHYNTPKLTEACIKSLRKHNMMQQVVILDNSDRMPFDATGMDNVSILDNTKGQLIDFAEELAKFPDKCETHAGVNDWGSDKHIMSVQYLMEQMPDGFLLVESDILVCRDVNFMIRPEYAVVGHIQQPQPGNKFGISRLLPMLCWINSKMILDAGGKYYDPNRAWMLCPETSRAAWYDTGATLLEDVIGLKPALHGLRINIRPLVVHYTSGSWRRNDEIKQDAWLQRFANLWK